MIVMREQLSVKERQAISETPAKRGRGRLVETCFSLLGRTAAFRRKRPWLGSCLQGLENRWSGRGTCVGRKAAVASRVTVEVRPINRPRTRREQLPCFRQQQKQFAPAVDFFCARRLYDERSSGQGCAAFRGCSAGRLRKCHLFAI